MWLRVAIGLFFLVHAFVHGRWRDYGSKTSWLWPHMGEPSARSLSTGLYVAAAVGFGIAGLAVLLGLGWWPLLAVAASIMSLILLVTFWQRGLIVGAAIDVAVLVALVVFR